MSRPSRKRLRLPDPLYRETGRVFAITIGTSPRSPIFLDISFGKECVQLLREMREETGTRVYAYCLMPDHVHLLGVTRGTSLLSVLGRWKSLCAKSRHRRLGSGQFWQRSFYDRAVRDDEDIISAAMYILGNPVRCGVGRGFPRLSVVRFDGV